MRIIIQRVTQASVEVENKIVGKIAHGLLILAGFEDTDTEEDLNWMTQKICGLRIFNDDKNVMNLSIQDINGDILLVSQFTLFAQTKKGNRPSYIRASKAEIAIPWYELFGQKIETNLQKKIQKGIFGADMKVSLRNDGPVTIFIDSKNRE